MFNSLKLSDLSERQCGVLRKSSSTRPAVWVAEKGGRRVTIKDYTPNSFFYRNAIGRFLIWRECKAYRRLRGLRGVPTFYGVVDGLALVTEEIPGRSLEDLEKEMKLPDEFFDDLRELVKDFHMRGLAHCDLKRAPNVLVGEDGKPYIVDWSSSIFEREFRFFPLTLIYQKFLQDDLDAIIKIQLRHSPGSISPEDKRRYYHRGKAEKLIRAVRDILRELLQKIA